MGDVVRYEHHRAAEFDAFQAPTGMTGRWTLAKAQEVSVAAKAAAPKPGQGKGYATGRLASSIRAETPTIGRKGPEAKIIAGTDHAVFVHEPTVPHVIKPRFKDKLVFFSRKAGRVLFKEEVHHPGTRGNPFLYRALQAIFGGPGR